LQAIVYGNAKTLIGNGNNSNALIPAVIKVMQEGVKIAGGLL
jgi:hypothetical protein